MCDRGVLGAVCGRGVLLRCSVVVCLLRCAVVVFQCDVRSCVLVRCSVVCAGAMFGRMCWCDVQSCVPVRCAGRGMLRVVCCRDALRAGAGRGVLGAVRVVVCGPGNE